MLVKILPECSKLMAIEGFVADPTNGILDATTLADKLKDKLPYITLHHATENWGTKIVAKNKDVFKVWRTESQIK